MTVKPYNRANPFHDKENIEIIRLKDRTDHWRKNRRKTLGASEVPTVIGKNPFSSTGLWGVWQEKVGITEPDFQMNEKMAFGLAFEDVIAEMWSYWHPYREWWNEYELSKREKVEKLRVCYNVNGIVYNKKFEWLSCNLDRIAPAGNMMADLRTLAEDHFPVEFKNLGEYVAKQYEDRVPHYYHAQAQTQMFLTETHYYEFAVLIGGQHLQVTGYKPDSSLIQEIIDKTGKFWYDHVIPARDIKQQANQYLEKADLRAYNQALDQIYNDHEPPAEEIDEQYHNYICERYQHEYTKDRPEYVQLSTDEELYERFQVHKLYSTLSREVGKHADQLKYELEAYFRENRIRVLEFEKGKATWFPNKGKDKPTFRNNVVRTGDIDKDAMQQFIKQLSILEYIKIEK